VVVASFFKGWDSVHLVLRPLFGLLYQPQMIDYECVAIGGKRIEGEIEVLGENRLSANLSTTNPTWPDPELELGSPRWEAGAYRLSYSMTFVVYFSLLSSPNERNNLVTGPCCVCIFLFSTFEMLDRFSRNSVWTATTTRRVEEPVV
jgi:hypothetical protein